VPQLNSGSVQHLGLTLHRLPADSILGVLRPTALPGIAKSALLTFVERTNQRRVIVTGARKSEYVPTQIRLAEAEPRFSALICYRATD